MTFVGLLGRLVRRTLGRIRRISNYLIGKFLFALLKRFCFLVKPRIVLTYANHLKTDGVGAQLQRIFAIRSLAHNLGFGYQHTEIRSVAIHPLDPYQTIDEMENFVKKLNAEFAMQDSDFDHHLEYRTREVISLSFSFLFSCAFKAILKPGPILIQCVEPYAVSELDPNLYSDLRSFIPNFHATPTQQHVIGIHYRRGVGGFSVQTGEKISRELTADYFVSVANKIVSENNNGNFRLVVFTDAPSTDGTYRPPVDQLDLWKSSQRFAEGEMQLLGLDLEQIFEKASPHVDIVYGGDPLDVIKRLSGMPYLVLSRSSFGYVAALLNGSGVIFFPSKFWHTPKRGWKVMNETDYE